MSVSFVLVSLISFAVNTVLLREKKGKKIAGDMISQIPTLEEKRISLIEILSNFVALRELNQNGIHSH